MKNTLDRRQEVMAIARDLLYHKKQCFYTEESSRWNWKHYTVPTFPFTSDCSGTVTAIDYYAGCNDPNGQNYEDGDTETILGHAQSNKLILPFSKLLHGDFILFGPGPKPVHVVMSMQSSFFHKNPICFSMGEQGDPSEVPLSVLVGLGSPTYVRNVTRHI